MTAPSRRILLYGLLLLLPTIAGGVGVIQLLRREQVRIDEQARVAIESRREVIQARARLIAENVELLVNDVESGLMSTLREAPAVAPDAFLDEWERTNPLVAATFAVGIDGRILRPGAARAEVRTWLAAWTREGAPWSIATPPVQKLESPSALSQRGDVSWNVGNFSNARNYLQESASQKVNIRARDEAQLQQISLDRTGWTPWRNDGRMRVVGWRETALHGVLGVELNLVAVTQRFAELLPKDGELAGVFAVRETGTTTASPRRDSSFGSSAAMLTRGKFVTPDEITVPIAEHVLPGWEVVGAMRLSEASDGAGGGFFLIGALLVSIIMLAILSGGSLLLWQARRSEAEAAQKTSFVANVSHEFKTPLTTIRLYAELLEQGRVRNAEQGADYLRTIGRETQRLARLVNNALDFSRLEQGKKKYAREPIELGAEIGRLVEIHAPRVKEAGLTLAGAFPTEQIAVTTDRDALEQIVLNLIDNACKYAAEGGEVTVTVAVGDERGSGEGRRAEVRVADRGPGVPAEHRERIFEKFHRVDDALTAEKTGAGLGLSIARQLARGLGGELRYAPRAGGGAEFILELP